MNYYDSTRSKDAILLMLDTLVSHLKTFPDTRLLDGVMFPDLDWEIRDGGSRGKCAEYKEFVLVEETGHPAWAGGRTVELSLQEANRAFLRLCEKNKLTDWFEWLYYPTPALAEDGFMFDNEVMFASLLNAQFLRLGVSVKIEAEAKIDYTKKVIVWLTHDDDSKELLIELHSGGRRNRAARRKVLCRLTELSYPSNWKPVYAAIDEALPQDYPHF